MDTATVAISTLIKGTLDDRLSGHNSVWDVEVYLHNIFGILAMSDKKWRKFLSWTSFFCSEMRWVTNM